MIIALTGFMGCGKSTVGRALSSLLGCQLIDLDDYIVDKEKKPIPQIFAEEGEHAFRAYEMKYLSQIIEQTESTDETVILSLGGGTVTNPACAELVHGHTRCIYLKASQAELESNLAGTDGRPMLKTHSISELLTKREPIYEAVAHEIIQVDGLSTAQITEIICKLFQ